MQRPKWHDELMGATRRFNAAVGLTATAEQELRRVLDQLLTEGHTPDEAVSIAAKSSHKAGTYNEDVQRAIFAWKRDIK